MLFSWSCVEGVACEESVAGFATSLLFLCSKISHVVAPAFICSSIFWFFYDPHSSLPSLVLWVQIGQRWSQVLNSDHREGGRENHLHSNIGPFSKRALEAACTRARRCIQGTSLDISSVLPLASTTKSSSIIPFKREFIKFMVLLLGNFWEIRPFYSRIPI